MLRGWLNFNFKCQWHLVSEEQKKFLEEFQNLTDEDKKKFLETLSAEDREAFLRLQDEYKQ